MMRPPGPKHPVLLPESKLKMLWTLVQNMQFCCRKIDWWCCVFRVQNTQLVSTKHTVKIATSRAKAPCIVATKQIKDAVNAGPKYAVLLPKNTLKMTRLPVIKPIVCHHKAHWRCCNFSRPKHPVLSPQTNWIALNSVKAGPKHAVLLLKNTLKMLYLSGPKHTVGLHKAHCKGLRLPGPKQPVLPPQSKLKML